MADYIRFIAIQTATSTGTVTVATEASLGFVAQYAFAVTLGNPTSGTPGAAFRIAIGHSSLAGDGDGKGAHGWFHQGGATRRHDVSGAGAGAGILIEQNAATQVAGEINCVSGTGVQVNYTTVNASVAYPVWLVIMGSDAGLDVHVAHPANTGLTTDFEPDFAWGANADLEADDAFSVCIGGIGVSDGSVHAGIGWEAPDIADEFGRAFGDYLPCELIAATWPNNSCRTPNGWSATGITWPFGSTTPYTQIAAVGGLERGVETFQFQADDSGTADATQNLSFSFVPGGLILISACCETKSAPAGSADYIGSVSIGIATQDGVFGQRWYLTTMDTGGSACDWATGSCIALGDDAAAPTKIGEIITWGTTTVIQWTTNDTTAPWVGGIAFEADPAAADEIDGEYIEPTSEVFAGVVEGEIDGVAIEPTVEVYAGVVEGEIDAEFLAATSEVYAGVVEGEIDGVAIESTAEVFAGVVEGEINGEYIEPTAEVYAGVVEGEIDGAVIASTAEVFAGVVEGEIDGVAIESTAEVFAGELEAGITAVRIEPTSEVFAGVVEGEIDGVFIAATTTIPAHQVQQAADISGEYIEPTSEVFAGVVEGEIDGVFIAAASQVFGGSIVAGINAEFLAATSEVYAGVVEGEVDGLHLGSAALVFPGSVSGEIDAEFIPSTSTVGPHSVAPAVMGVRIEPTSEVFAGTLSGAINGVFWGPTSEVPRHEVRPTDVSFPQPVAFFRVQRLPVFTKVQIPMPCPSSIPEPMFTIYQGATGPSWRWGLFNSQNEMLSFVGATFVLSIKLKGAVASEAFDLTGDIEADTSVPGYNLRIDFDEADTDRVSGVYQAVLWITWATGEVQAHPYEPAEFFIAPSLES